ncbi:MAG TPA: preprotein translocase subunit SecA, partial [Smithellaceae bacterium]|nr:preprotein translocase subunit SecA [Smithellaceae bacterium]
MLGTILKKIVGTKNDRELKRLSLLLDEVNSFEADMMSLGDNDLQAKTIYFREKLNKGLTLDDILTEAFAVAREAARRTLKMRPFDVQILGGIALHEGKIAEMKTG